MGWMLLLLNLFALLKVLTNEIFSLDDGGVEIDDSSTVAGMSVYTMNTDTQGTASSASVGGLTMGGKKPQNRRKKKKGLRIRQGSIFTHHLALLSYSWI